MASSSPVVDELAVGLQGIAWGADEASVRALFPHAVALAPVHARDASTRAVVRLPAALFIRDFLVFPGLSLSALVGFSAGHVVGFDLYPSGGFDKFSPVALHGRGLQRVAARLGLDLATLTGKEATWTVGNVVIDVVVQKADFIVSIYAPGTEALGRRTTAQRAYRLLQAQRAVRR